MTKKKEVALWTLGGILLISLFTLAYLVHIQKDMSDFGVCYKNGQRIIRGETLYRLSDGHLQFKYAPVSALIYAPLALLPYETAKVIWYILEICLLFAVFWVSYKLLPSRLKGPWFVLGLSFLALLKFIGREIELGQVNILIIFVLIMMLRTVVKKKDVSAGILWGISLFVKPYALIFLPYFILKKRFKLIATGLIVLIVGLALPVLTFGFKGNLLVLKEWAFTLSRSTPGQIAAGDTASLYAFLWKILPGHPDFWTMFLWLVIGSAVGVVFLWMMGEGRKRDLNMPEILEAAFLMILIPFFSPLSWNYNYLYSVLAVVLILNYWPRFPLAWKYVLAVDLILIGATLQEVLGKTLFRFYTYNSLIVINFLIVLAALAYIRAAEVNSRYFRPKAV
jgi:hypothetical protein